MTFNEGLPPYARLRSGIVSNEGLDEIDPNVVLISDYLAGELLDDDQAALEHRLETDAAFFNEMMPIIEFVEALRSTRHHVAENTSERIKLDGFLGLSVGVGATAVVVTPLGELTLKEGTYTLDWSPPGHIGELRAYRSGGTPK